MLRSVALDTLRVLAISGPDRVSFLQGQLTQDVTAARADRTILAGWADAKGRLLFAGHLCVLPVAAEDALALLVPAELADSLAKRLRLYVLRAKAQVSLPDVTITGLLNESALADHGRPDTPSVQVCGDASRRFTFTATAAPALSEVEVAPHSDWELAEIRAGIPVILPATSGEFVPQMVNLDLLGGISFTKGCYTGQEIVARMKYLGRVKRRMLHFSCAELPAAAGAPVYGERGVVGQVVRAVPTAGGSEFLAVMVLDDLPGPFFIDESRVHAARRLELPYEVAG